MNLHPRISTLSIILCSALLHLSTSATAQSTSEQVQLVQAEVGVFVDSKGRRVFYDLRTDKILRIELPPTPRVIPGNPSTRSAAAPPKIMRAPLAPAQPRTQQRAPEDNVPQSVSPEEAQIAALPRATTPFHMSPKEVARLQVLLDRMGISPGVIDGQMGSNVRKALQSARQKTGREFELLTDEELKAELDATGGPAFVEYEITTADVRQDYVASIPVDYAQKAKLGAMSFTSPSEMLAERFHMSENYLKTLNPDVDFWRVGSKLTVANPGKDRVGSVVRIEADKGAEQVRAYDANDTLVAAYPSTIGSAATPSPSGTVTIERIALNPNYTYNPKINFTQGNNRSILTIPPGPNGPVGSVWLALSKPTYGIHGTPEPSRIGKSNSHGCIRLTNWDAEELASLVTEGVSVVFLD